jgi:iron complex outermembrane receptor protein
MRRRSRLAWCGAVAQPGAQPVAQPVAQPGALAGVQAGVLAGALAIGIAAPAHAQQVDYGALEQMFGQPVTTSATGSPQLAAQAPADMTIVTADDIRRSGATSIPQILDFVAGIDVRAYGAQDSDVAIRGFSQSFNPRLLVLVNGRQVYIDDYGYVAWQAIPVQLSDIRQIEVVRGPASALFGFNAVSGVINIITYDPLYDKTNVATAGYGSDGTVLGSLVTTAQLPGKAGVTISLGGIRTNEFSDREDVAAQGFYVAEPNLGNTSIDGRWKPTDSTEATAEVTDSSTNGSGDLDYTPGVSNYRVQSAKAGFSADTRLGLASLQAYINRVKSGFSNAGSPDGINLENQVTVVQASDLIKIANVHALRFGLEFRQNRGWGATYQGTLGDQDYAADVMWNWQITPQLALTNAGRIDHLALSFAGTTLPGNPATLADFNAATITAPSFNSGLVYQPDASDTIRALVGRGVQAPSLVGLGVQAAIVLGPVHVVLAGDPDLKPMTVTNYELDYDRALAPILSTVSAAVFYQVDRGFQLSAPSAPPTFRGADVLLLSGNIGNMQGLGGELSLDGSSPGGWRWDLSYALFGAHQEFTYRAPEIPYDFNTATPTSQIIAELGYSWRRWEADAAAKYQSQYTDYHSVDGAVEPHPVSNFVTLDARICYDVTRRLTLAVTGDELTAPEITETAALPPDRRVLFTAAYGF